MPRFPKEKDWALFITEGIKRTVSLNQRRMFTQMMLQEETRWVMERTEQTGSKEAEDALRDVTIERLDESVSARRALRSPWPSMYFKMTCHSISVNCWEHCGPRESQENWKKDSVRVEFPLSAFPDCPYTQISRFQEGVCPFQKSWVTLPPEGAARTSDSCLYSWCWSQAELCHEGSQSSLKKEDGPGNFMVPAAWDRPLLWASETRRE